jgi:hypothetical protein
MQKLEEFQSSTYFSREPKALATPASIHDLDGLWG